MIGAPSVRHAWAHLAGATFGAGLASLASAAAPVSPGISFGPPEIIVAGVEIPVFSAIFGIVGILLSRRVAPASVAGARLGRAGNAALTALLAMGIVALVIAGEKRPIVALGWAIGLGYSGLGVVELVARGVIAAVQITIDAFVNAWKARGGGSAQ